MEPGGEDTAVKGPGPFGPKGDLCGALCLPEGSMWDTCAETLGSAEGLVGGTLWQPSAFFKSFKLDPRPWAGEIRSG